MAAEPTEADPLVALRRLVPPAEVPDRPVVVLATIGLDGCPDARNVLLSEVDEIGLTFHTDVRSRKVAELSADGRACMVATWPERARQVVVQGNVDRLPRSEEERVFALRSRYLQILAWVNEPDVARRPAAERQERWAAFARGRGEGAIEAPPTWAGFRLVPHRMVFWQGDTGGPSNRIEYTRRAPGWATRRLPG